MKRLLLFVLFYTGFLNAWGQANGIYKKHNQDLLPDGRTYTFWENTTKTTKTYYVDKRNPEASDNNPGTKTQPFLTINQAASIVQAGEQVLIMPGIYRESVTPQHGGNAPDKMIIYEAEKPGTVIIKGSYVLDPEKWSKGQGWRYGNQYGENKEYNIWQYELEGNMFMGYNPFGMVNMLHDREWLQHRKEVKIWPHLKRRGLLFIDSIPAKQVEKAWDMGDVGSDTICFWIEHNGLRIHVRYPEGSHPSDFFVEATNKEQVFAPTQYGLGYIHLKGIHFKHAGNGFPVPQRGLVSTSRGHHWIIENCTLEWANAVGIDMGHEMWGTSTPNKQEGHIFRQNIVRNCGISGLQGMHMQKALIEDNLFENIGWQDAELAFESGGIKLHATNNTLIRRNIFRNITYAPGLWLDYQSTRNTRINNNVFTGIKTARGAIYIEASHAHCLVDHNLFHHVTSQYWLSGDYGAGGSALYTDGSDSIHFQHNIAFNIENTGYGAYLNAERLVDRRGGITRFHRIEYNIFAGCQKHSIELANEYNFTNSNVYSNPGRGYIKIGNPAPPLLLDRKAVQTLYNWEENGIVLNKKEALLFTLDADKLHLTITGNDLSCIQKTDAGPFRDITKIKAVNIDPRKHNKP